jgi:Mannosyltransferase (PIG-V)
MTAREISRLLGFAALWAAALFLLAFTAFRTLPDVNGFGRLWSRRPVEMSSRYPLARWDSFWYADIVKEGYEGRNDGAQHNVVFYPLYPMIVGAVAGVFRCDPLMAGSGVSLAALLAAIVVLGLLAREEGFDAGATARALLWFPTAFFFAAVYTESLFLLVTVASLLAARRGRYGVAALFGLLAGLCRPTGFLLAIPLAWPLLEKRPVRIDRQSLAILFAAISPLLGLGSFLLFVRLRLGDAMLPFEIQNSGWLHHFSWPWRPIIRGWFWAPRLQFQVAATLAFFGLAALLWKRHRAYALYIAGTLLMACMSGTVMSVPRFDLALFPAFFILGEALRKSRLAEAVYATAGILGLAYCTCRFVAGLWVA